MTEPRVPRLTVDIVSDVMCPWCIIGWLKFRKVIDHFAGRLDFRVQWHPFELNPDMPPEGEESRAHIARKYGRTPEQAEAGRTMMAERAAAAGFPFDYTGPGDPPRSMLWNTFDAHKLLKWTLDSAGAKAQTRLKLALFAAYFQDNRDVSDEEVRYIIAEAETSGAMQPAESQMIAGVMRIADRTAALKRQQASKRQAQPAYVQVAMKALPGNPATEQEQLFRRIRGWLSLDVKAPASQ